MRASLALREVAFALVVGARGVDEARRGIAKGVGWCDADAV